MPHRPDPYGLLARFENVEGLLAGVGAVRGAGYTRIDAFTPFPVEGLARAIGFEERRLPWIALIGGIVGGAGGFLLTYGLNAWDYPINVGGRPLNAWPAFAVPAFEMMVLFAALAVILGLLILNRLPRLNHPVFEVPDFRRATVDGFFLLIRSDDPLFRVERTGRALEKAGAVGIDEVPS
ncbi:MAG TPA: DUF3341 domain-containing protein [Geminicoccaceae bacterium]